MAVQNIAANNDGNQQALRVHIDTIIGVLQGHASNAEVREAGLETVIYVICTMCRGYYI